MAQRPTADSPIVKFALLLADAVQVPLATQVEALVVGDGRRVGQCLLGGKGPDSVQACFDAIAAEHLELAAGGEDERCPLVVEYAQAVADSCGLAATGTAL